MEVISFAFEVAQKGCKRVIVLGKGGRTHFCRGKVLRVDTTTPPKPCKSPKHLVRAPHAVEGERTPRTEAGSPYLAKALNLLMSTICSAFSVSTISSRVELELEAGLRVDDDIVNSVA